jgi:hypothetical protein
VKNDDGDVLGRIGTFLYGDAAGLDHLRLLGKHEASPRAGAHKKKI